MLNFILTVQSVGTYLSELVGLIAFIGLSLIAIIAFLKGAQP